MQQCEPILTMKSVISTLILLLGICSSLSRADVPSVDRIVQNRPTKNEEEQQDTTATSNTKDASCSLYFAESQLGGLGVYTGVDIKEGSPIGNGELILPFVDPNTKEWAFWMNHFWRGDLMDDLQHENMHELHIFVPGLGTHIQCHSKYANVYLEDDYLAQDSVGVHRARDASAGAFSYRYNYTDVAQRDIQAGEELFLSCEESMDARNKIGRREPKTKSFEWLSTHAFCMDRMYVDVSKIPGAGRGAFATRAMSKGSVVSTSPVIHIDRYQLDIVEQHMAGDPHNFEELYIVYTQHKKGKQLLLNYCFGHENSNMMLLPYGSMVNYINHNHQNPNVSIRWSPELEEELETLFDIPAYDLLNMMKSIEIEYVALRDIQEGEEIFLDYGKEWEAAWKEHVENWTPLEGSADYISATEYMAAHPHEKIRTVKESGSNPYPPNIYTVCFFMETKNDVNHMDKQGRFIWREENNSCLRPCHVLERFRGKYTARMSAMEGYTTTDWCDLSGDDVVVAGIPDHAVTLADKPYTSDLHLPNAFRHEIGAPEGFYPENWMIPDTEHEVKVASKKLKGGELAQMTLETTGEAVSKYGYQIGIPESVTEALLDYCNRMGITDKFRSLLIDGNPLQPGQDEYVNFGGYEWYVQRPPAKWRSNMHWISPADEKAHIDYLRVLGTGGYDELLQKIGEFFDLDGLLVYHLTFIGVSHCSQGYSHYDFSGVEGKAFNMIIPLILANNTGPELDVSRDRPRDDLTAGYKYEIGAASMVGDDTYHATAACDYRDSGEMRMAATVYMADVNEKNVMSIVKDFTQAYPPPGDRDYILSRAGSHWKKDDPAKHLPEPLAPSDFLTNPLEPGEIASVMMEKGHDQHVDHVYRMGLPKKLTKTLLEYSERMGIQAKVYELLHGGEELQPDRDEYTTFRGYNWLIQRPPPHWHSNMHWISPADEQAHENFLEALSEAGFDYLLNKIGNYFGYDGLVAYHLTFIAVSYCQKGYVHYDVPSIGGHMFNVIVPLILATETGPELEILDEDSNLLGGYKYEDGYAIMVGDSAMHATGEVDYRYTGEMRLAATIYIADVNDENAEQLMKDFTQVFPRAGDTEFLLERRANHWKKGDPSKHLPVPSGDFLAPKLQPKEISQIVWASNGEPVTNYAFRVGLPRKLSDVLRKYCARIGITDKYRELLIDGKPLRAGHNQYTQFGGHNWYIQRPQSFWKSNMHWISPADEDAHTDYLKALSAGGFDELLQSMGEYFDLEGLSCYHITFIGVSQCSRGYVHYDFTGAQGRAFNMIIPLILANETGPELDLQSSDGRMVGGYKYEHGVASMVGDDAFHATAACDYTDTGEMRMAATIYIADINESNVDAIMKDFTQAYPPREDTDYLLGRAGNHWRWDDPSKKLPEPEPDHVLMDEL